MNSAFLIFLSLIVAFLGGIAVGVCLGVAKGVKIGMRLQDRRPDSQIPWILSLIVAALCLIAAVGTAVDSAVFLSRSVVARAQVARVDERRDQEGRVSRRVIYQFKDSTGVSHEGRSDSGHDPDLVVGDSLQIRYLVGTPEKSRVDTFVRHWFLSLFMSVFSLVFAAIGFGLRRWRERELLRWNARIAESSVLPGNAGT